MPEDKRRLEVDRKRDYLACAFHGIDTHADPFISTFLPPETASRTSLLLVNRAGRFGIIEFSSIHEFDSFVEVFSPPLCARAGTLEG
jgi:hypothetical protein